jgi:Ca2+-binding EF-hand superfamily protein
MGAHNSKTLFTEWDLTQFSNVTGVPLSMVKKIYKDFITYTQNDNKIDKTEFRRLYKKMYVNSQASSLPSGLPPFFTEHDLNKMSDHVFDTYDFDGTGNLTFEEFAEAYLMLTHHASMPTNRATFHDRFNYILDQGNPTPGFITREHGEQAFNRLNRYNHWLNSKAATSTDSYKPATTSWESHWSKLDDGSGRVPKEKFVDYITTSNDYKHHFDPATV